MSVSFSRGGVGVIGYLSEVDPDNKFPSGPLRAANRPLPYEFLLFIFPTRGTHELMIFQSLALGSVERRRGGMSSPCRSVLLEGPLEHEWLESKADHE